MTHAVHAASALLPRGWVDNVRIEVEGGLIGRIACGVAAEPDDERADWLIPGMPNLHSHAFQRAIAGRGEMRGRGEDSFWSWRQAMYRFVERLDPEAMQAIAAMAYAEMLEGGFTRVGEFHYLHNAPDGACYADPATMAAALVAAADETGLALTLLPVFYAHSGFGAQPPQAGQARFVNTLDSFARLHEACGAALSALPDAQLGVAPHSLRAVAPDELAALTALAGEAPIHIHIAEQVGEVEDSLAWSGQRPVDWLLDHAEVGSNWCLVHATHMTPDETARLASSGAVAGLCPITEANLGDGLFPASAYLGAGGAWGVGSDSNVRIDMFEELRWFEYGQRLALRKRNVVASGEGQSTGAALFDQAGQGGARALGASFGLAPGHSADFVSLDSRHGAFAAMPEALRVDAAVFVAGREAIDGVWRRGRKMVSEGRHHARAEIAARYAATLARLVV
ncbi:formimidoylglutamate deiminase [Novosphingobium kunmingense]|uniref:Formimidoylglutamate deiminase n=1 Tax=Novosphingobium kunmingense TaxID=1211806 RepID=A0A2N0H363_9SPHN|nr:formimidoylglutamate deiminase [Novosphingobium kunmingense]PKB13386.1 formimidoylglutamate deiminase [Novosphingobium kunmingense]